MQRFHSASRHNLGRSGAISSEFVSARQGVAVVVVLVMALLLSGCSREIVGSAQRDPSRPGSAITEDGYGIRIGFPQAPVRIEVYTEPQCPHCAELQADFGADFAHYVDLGRLSVTYRPLTFFDRDGSQHSARVSNAMFLAAGPGTTGPEFQDFVAALWAEHGAGQEPSDADLAELAAAHGVGDAQAGEITAGAAAVDTADMTAVNSELLWQIDPQRAGTPTVYDLVADEPVDLRDADWLSRLLAA